ncbi:hypothetical protein Tco_0526482 [Tanacetum coccineum]
MPLIGQDTSRVSHVDARKHTRKEIFALKPLVKKHKYYDIRNATLAIRVLTYLIHRLTKDPSLIKGMDEYHAWEEYVERPRSFSLSYKYKTFSLTAEIKRYSVILCYGWNCCLWFIAFPGELRVYMDFTAYPCDIARKLVDSFTELFLALYRERPL